MQHDCLLVTVSSGSTVVFSCQCCGVDAQATGNTIYTKHGPGPRGTGAEMVGGPVKCDCQWIPMLSGL